MRNRFNRLERLISFKQVRKARIVEDRTKVTVSTRAVSSNTIEKIYRNLQVQVLIWKKFHYRLPLPKHQTGGRCNTTVLTKVLFYRNGCWSTQNRVQLTDSRSVLNMSVSLWISSTSAFFSLDVWFIRGFILSHSFIASTFTGIRVCVQRVFEEFANGNRRKTRARVPMLLFPSWTRN